jgi:hypothetical protein
MLLFVVAASFFLFVVITSMQTCTLHHTTTPVSSLPRSNVHLCAARNDKCCGTTSHSRYDMQPTKNTHCIRTSGCCKCNFLYITNKSLYLYSATCRMYIEVTDKVTKTPTRAYYYIEEHIVLLLLMFFFLFDEEMYRK